MTMPPLSREKLGFNDKEWKQIEKVAKRCKTKPERFGRIMRTISPNQFNPDLLEHMSKFHSALRELNQRTCGSSTSTLSACREEVQALANKQASFKHSKGQFADKPTDAMYKEAEQAMPATTPSGPAAGG